MKLHNAIIYLLGYAGVGKYTVAQEIARRTGARVIDNQLINNPIFTIVREDGKTRLPEAVWGYVGMIRRTVLEAIEQIAAPQHSFVFTNEYYEDDPEDHAGYAQIERLAAARGAVFLPVRLLADADALRQRKDTPQRHARLKETDMENIQWKLDNRVVLQVKHPHALTLDTSRLSAEQVADAILNHVRECYAH